MKAVSIHAEKRSQTGKGAARKLRALGAVPGIFYGETTEPLTLQLNRREITSILSKSTSDHILVDVAMAGNGESQMALLRDVQRDPITGEILHVDLLHILPTKKIRVTVPVHITGVADGVKNFGGILQHIARELEIESLPTDIPEMIDIAVDNMGIGDAIHVRDVERPGVTFVTPGDRTIVSVVPPTVVKEVVETTEEAAPEAAAGEPEVIGEKKEDTESSEGGKPRSA